MKTKEKKDYQAPAIEVIYIESQSVLCGSNRDTNTETFNEGHFSIGNP